MLLRALGGVALAVALAGCVRADADPLGALRAWLAAPGATPPPDTLASSRQAARSVWGVVPDPPRRKADLRPGLIAGSAVAVSDDTLLANCAVVGRRSRVGLVRHNKYRLARVAAGGPGEACRLTVAEGPLTPVAGFRSFADLRVGEPVIVLSSRTSAQVAAAPGWLAGKGAAEDPFLETTVAAPTGSRSTVLVDGFGNLIGLGAAPPVAGGLLLAVPLAPASVPDLARHDLAEAPALTAALAPVPRIEPWQPPILLALGTDDRDSADRVPAARRADAATDEASGPAASGGSPGGGSTPAPGAATGGSDGSAAPGTGADPAPGSPSGGTGSGPEPDRASDDDDDDDRGRGRERDGRRHDRDEARGDTRGPGRNGRGRGRDRGEDDD